MSALEPRLLKAHEENDRAALARLYLEAARPGPSESFYLTHAYVYALEAGLPLAEIIRARLIALGCEPAERP